ncbi:MAG: EAL domain-containing protein, partial [Burkholderiales bacterium]|nr:EAL domain-containing protein [Burkholderiales bacterium]
DGSGGFIEPEGFLNAAERYNLMPEIDRWVIRQVFSHYHQLVAERGGGPLTCCINLSGASINTEGFFDFIRQQIERYQPGAGTICFELTENVAINNLQATEQFIRQCKSIGIEFALDDFGIGNSSLGYLKNLSVDYLKIDGGFIRNIERDKIDLALAETVNRIGHILGKKTVAEHVENDAIIDILRTMGIDYAQGNGVCPPCPLLARIS